jgi:hypothetical protein
MAIKIFDIPRSDVYRLDILKNAVNEQDQLKDLPPDEQDQVLYFFIKIVLDAAANLSISDMFNHIAKEVKQKELPDEFAQILVQWCLSLSILDKKQLRAFLSSDNPIL